MLWFKTFGNAEVTLSGIELANKIKKGQFDTSEITSPGAMILQVWEAVLAAQGEIENRLSLPALKDLHQNRRALPSVYNIFSHYAQASFNSS
jgi:hypothetical protein